MEIQASRLAARIGPDGALAAADRAGSRALGPAADPPGPRGAGRAPKRCGRATGPTVLQAALAACHARARSAGRHRLAAHRRALRPAARGDALAGGRSQPGDRPQGMAFGPEAGLRLRGRDRRRGRPARLCAAAGGAGRFSCSGPADGPRRAARSRRRPGLPATRARRPPSWPARRLAAERMSPSRVLLAQRGEVVRIFANGEAGGRECFELKPPPPPAEVVGGPLPAVREKFRPPPTFGR